MKMPEDFSVENRTGYAAVMPASTELLRLIVADGVDRDYNRQLEWSEVEKIADPNGYHILQSVLYHEHVLGEAQPPENHQIRAKVMLKSKGSKKAVDAGFVDVNVVLWNNLAAFCQRVAETHGMFLDLLKEESGS